MMPDDGTYLVDNKPRPSCKRANLSIEKTRLQFRNSKTKELGHYIVHNQQY